MNDLRLFFANVFLSLLVLSSFCAFAAPSREDHLKTIHDYFASLTEMEAHQFRLAAQIKNLEKTMSKVRNAVLLDEGDRRLNKMRDDHFLNENSAYNRFQNFRQLVDNSIAQLNDITLLNDLSEIELKIYQLFDLPSAPEQVLALTRIRKQLQKEIECENDLKDRYIEILNRFMDGTIH